ncbi:type I-D CRISPR-associated protein Cas5/Csc1 [Gloeothece verrucosa]|uniref:CRISPR-associated protein Csc1 n=1 Tax=Gloeothece verrucosa (strain PCC 7822) TaxID=497965 RepID=E0UKL7_GLOV7|nr:type I-D CRISPR-associated protein Cas5/Csc1 [Gloeothece verrucosa]ADN17497.1 CRISPR-associated protein Csc1 [Gloeothece verrucosa PCC 7822]
MKLYHCLLTLHDNVFFASREMGILYETEKYLHNWALSYAFFKVTYIPHPYRLQGEAAQKPNYLNDNNEQNLNHLNRAGVYVFPAKPLYWSYQVNTFKAAQSAYYGRFKKFGEDEAVKNYPFNYGRAKELAVGSQYRTYIMAKNEISEEIPHWIRLGKWSAKIEVSIIPIPESLIQNKSGEYLCDHPLNPLDLSDTTQLQLYNRIVMPPVSLVSQAQLQGNYYSVLGDNWKEFKQNFPSLPEQIYLPKGAFYGARYMANV